MARFLKYGISTGACAAAAAKAAMLTLTQRSVDKVVIPTPIGIRFEIPVKSTKKLSDLVAKAIVIKDSGEDKDVTNGIEIIATIKLTDNEKIDIKSGQGVGKVTKPGLQVPIGEAAINPVPRQMISDAIKEALPHGKGAEVIITVPKGEKIAEKTFNSKLGIVGGISILGTTGVVKPFSIKAYKSSLVPQIDVALSQGGNRIFVVPGNIGENLVKQLFNAPDHLIVQTGDFMGYMLGKATEKGVKEIILVGHPGKLVKLAANIFNTHHKMGDARNEVIGAYAGALGADATIINAILKSNTTEESAAILESVNLSRPVFDKIAQKINEQVTARTQNKIKFWVFIVSMEGKILGTDENARCLKLD